MATAYGAGARSKREALILIAVFALIGSLVAGAPVIKTMGKGIVPESVLSSHLGFVLIILIIAIFFISWANIVRVPVATTHAIVCAIAGVGLYSSGLNYKKFFEIVIWWVVTPFVAWFFNYLVGRYLYFRTLRFLTNRYSEEGIRRILGLLITVSGCYVAFSAGANNAANSVGPLVGIGLIGPSFSGIIGFSCANQGFTATARNNHVLRIAFFWFLVPFFAVAASYFMSSLYFKYGVAAMLGKNF